LVGLILRSPACPGSGIRTPKQIGRFQSEDSRKPVHDIDPSRIDAAFQGAHISAIDLRTVRQFFLRQALSLPLLSEI
jgi:hypothetical protein